MKHHLKLLCKSPNKKHLHFFQNLFPTFLQLFFFFFSFPYLKGFSSISINSQNISANWLVSFQWENFLLESIIPFCAATSHEAERKQSPGEMLAFLRLQLHHGTLSFGTCTPAYRYPPTSTGRRFRLSFIPDGQGWMLCEHLALSCLYFWLRQQPLPLSQCKSNITCCNQHSTHQPSSFQHLWAYCGTSDKTR